MTFPLRIDLFYVPAGVRVDAEILQLTDELIASEMGEHWWNEAVVDDELAAREIDRYWDWIELEIERNGEVLAPERLAVITPDGNVQGAAMFSDEGVGCFAEPGRKGLFVELLSTAPRNRKWLRRDKSEQLLGVGLELLCAMAQESVERGLEGRLKLESSPSFVHWYEKRGLLRTGENPILHEGVWYTPMELTGQAASKLLLEE
jgi:hypothetical protein